MPLISLGNKTITFSKKTTLISALSLVTIVLNILINFPLISFLESLVLLGTFFRFFLTSISFILREICKIEYSKSMYLLYFLFQISLLIVLLLWYFKINYLQDYYLEFGFYLSLSWLDKLNLISKVLISELLIKSELKCLVSLIG